MQPLHDLLSIKRKTLERKLEREGFESITHLPYEKYLRSALWLAIREWVIERDKGICTICERTAAEVHHHDYDKTTMWGEQPDSLTSLCARCHQLVEFNELNQKRDCLSDKRQVYEDLKNLYAQLISEKLQCTIKKTPRRNITTVHIEYNGNKEFLKFVNLPFEAYIGAIPHEFEFHKIAKCPMPLSAEKLEQKSGLQIRSRETNKIMAIIKASKISITLKTYTGNPIPFENKLLSHLEQNCYTHFVRK